MSQNERSGDMRSGSENPRCDALELDKLDSNDLMAWKTLARQLEREMAGSAVTQEMLDFLHGTCALDGVWFGEDHPKYRGRFWWRVLLPETVASATASPIVAVLERIKKTLEAASEERYQELHDWERLAAKWKAEGDMYGWNFHQGMAAGANWCDIFYRRIGRELDAIGKESAQPEGRANLEEPKS